MTNDGFAYRQQPRDSRRISQDFSVWREQMQERQAKREGAYTEVRDREIREVFHRIFPPKKRQKIIPCYSLTGELIFLFSCKNAIGFLAIRVFPNSISICGCPRQYYGYRFICIPRYDCSLEFTSLFFFC